MNTQQLNGRPVSCWKQENGTYHMAVSDGEGSGGVIVMSQFDLLSELGGRESQAAVDLAIATKSPTTEP